MCFYNDYDWYAGVTINRIENEGCVPDLEAGGEHPICEECGALIVAGSPHRYIYQQEHECCQNEDCGIYTDDELGEEEEGECRCESPDLGETFIYRRCMECDKFLSAVERVERDAGCGGDEVRPALSCMIDEIREAGLNGDDPEKYFARASADFPELVASGYIAELRSRVMPEKAGTP